MEDGGGVTERSFVDGNDPNSRTAMASGLSLPGCASILATSVHSVSLALSRNSSAEEKTQKEKKKARFVDLHTKLVPCDVAYFSL